MTLKSSLCSVRAEIFIVSILYGGHFEIQDHVTIMLEELRLSRNLLKLSYLLGDCAKFHTLITI